MFTDPQTAFETEGTAWYEKSTNYWSMQDPTIKGMLGGYPQLSGFDLADSRRFIENMQNKYKMGHAKVADCGAGIGRVSYYVLQYCFDALLLVDPVKSFLTEAKKKIGVKKEVETVTAGIQTWRPTENYDCFWIQWALMYLKDDDCIEFLKSCKEHLNPNGFIIVKDNLASDFLLLPKEKAQFYSEDNGICRSYIHYEELFKKAGLKIVEKEFQRRWPRDLLPLMTFALQ